MHIDRTIFVSYMILVVLTLFTLCFGRKLPDATSKVLVFSDQINDNPGSLNFTFAANHYIGMQKIDKVKIDAYKAVNPDFIAIQYHKAYGVDLGGNITNAQQPFWNNDCDTLYAWQKRNNQYGALEGYYLHFGNVIDSLHRIPHYWDNHNEYWLADIRNDGYKRYVAEETSRRSKEIGFVGTFFDCAYFPSFGYVPENWCTTAPWNAQSIVNFGKTWNDSFANPFWSYVSNYYHAEQRDYLSLPNCDQMVTGWYNDDYLNFVDGAMVEGFFTYGGKLTGEDWTLSAGRILKYLTGKDKNKIMIAQPAPEIDNISLRRWCIANYFLLKNRYSYYNIAFSSTVNWWPEYEIDLGEFISVPSNLEELRVSGAQSLYKRDYKNGLVIVNPGTSTQSFSLSEPYNQVAFSGGGNLNNGSLPVMNLSYGNPVSGNVTVASGEVLILKSVNTTGVHKKTLNNANSHNMEQNQTIRVTLNGKRIQDHPEKIGQPAIMSTYNGDVRLDMGFKKNATKNR